MPMTTEMVGPSVILMERPARQVTLTATGFDLVKTFSPYNILSYSNFA